MAVQPAPSTTTINVGSRCSELALCQTNLVISKLTEISPDLKFNVIKMTTKGDEIQDKALSKIGGKALFTKELEIALDNNTVDFVVHSLKDLPTTLPPGLTIGAVIKRHDPRDCVVLHIKHRAVTRLAELPAGAILGTSSLRRVAQLARNYPHLRFENIRGNLNTRLRKLDQDGKYDGIVLAAAGIERLGWKERVNIWLEKHDMLYAISQGAMAVECRDSDAKTITMLSAINDAHTAIRITAERTLMKELNGGCSVPIGTWSVLDEYRLTVSGAVFSVDGAEMLFSERADMMPAAADLTSHHQVIDMLHCNRPKLTDDVTAVTSLLNNNIIVHRTGLCCKTADVNRFNAAESCGRYLAQSLLRKGAKEVLDRARAAGLIVNVNQAPVKRTPAKISISEGDGLPCESVGHSNGNSLVDSVDQPPRKKSRTDVT